MTAQDARWLSLDEIAIHLGVSRDTLYKWLVRKNMPAHKVGRLWKFKLTEIDAWVKSGSASSKSRAKRKHRRAS